MSDVGLAIKAQVTIDGKPCALLAIANDLSGTDERPTYHVSLSCFRERRVLTTSIKDYERAGKTRLDLLAEAFRMIAEGFKEFAERERRGLPAALLRAMRVPLSDYSGYLCLLPMDGDAVTCPMCNDGRALGLAVLRQAMPSGDWSYTCLPCAGPREEALCTPTTATATP